MWEDYAKARGLTTASLTQAQKVEAEYLGIITETQMQVGDLAKASETLAGAQAENAATATQLAVTYGNAMAPAMQSVTEVSTGLFNGLTGIVSAAPGAAAGITATAAALALLITGASAAQGVMSLFAAGTIALNPVMVALAAGIGIAAGAYTEFKKRQDAVTEAEEEAAKAAEAERTARAQKVEDLAAQATELGRLGEEYRTLAGTEERTAEQSERLDRVIGILVTQYGISEGALRDLANGYDSGNDAIQDRIGMLQAEQRELLEKTKLEKQALLEQRQYENQNRAALMAQLVMGGKPDFENASNWIRDESGNLLDDTGWKAALDNWLAGFYGKAPEVIEAAQELHDALYSAENYEQAKAIYNAYFNGIKKESEEAAAEIEKLGEEILAIDEAIANPNEANVNRVYSGETQEQGENRKRTAEEITAEAEAAAEAARAQYDETQKLIEAQKQLNILMDEAATAAEREAAAKALQEAGWGEGLLGNLQAQADLQAYILTQTETLNASLAESLQNAKGLADELTASFEAGEISAEEYYSQIAELWDVIGNLSTGVTIDSSGVTSFGKAAETTAEIIDDLEKEGAAAGKKLENALNFRAEIRSMKDLAKQVKDTGGGWDDLSDEVKAFANRMGIAEGDIDGTISALEGMETQTDASIGALESDLRGTLSTLEAMRAEIMAIPTAELTADNSQALASINQAIALVNFFLALLGKAGIEPTATASRGGGGGSSKRDTSAEDAKRAQEEAYQSAVEAIEHKRHLNQITAQEEIAELERVKRQYARTAEQIMDIDERIYDARQDLRDEEESKIDSLYDSIVDALEERYEEQREIEQKRISDSIKSWEKWSDDTCAAIQKQIDALDEQAQAEDRAATEAENLRKIASLEQALAYEKDAYNQRQLIKQIEQAQAAWAEIQKGWQTEDARKALEDQMQAVQDQADAEIEILEKESERIDSVYDEMTKGQSLAAEAQKLLMQSSQEDLLALLTSYAPDYEATGRTLGEKIYEGFKSAFGDISAFFAQIDAQFEQMAERNAQAAFGATQGIQSSGQAAASVSSPTINQTVNFNLPVESPADVTRRMQQVSEELAGMV